MSLLDFFARKEEYKNKNSAKVVVIIKSKDPNVELIKTGVFEFWDRVKISIPKSIIYIEDFSKPSPHAGKVADAYIEDYKKYPKIHLNAKSHDNKKRVFSSIMHEIDHFKNMEWRNIQRRVNPRINKAIKNLRRIDYSRYYFRDFLYATLSEGSARFAQNTLIRNIHFNDSEFLTIYGLAKNEAELFLNIWNRYIQFYRTNNLKEAGNEIKEITNLCKRSYTIGFHIYYTLACKGKYPVLKKDIFKIINLYEETIISMGYKPVISINSGKGILDYNALVSSWYGLEK
ncbi:MAG: hypothetical protein AABW52_01880 [Nanoarchaeota archaeon]